MISVVVPTLNEAQRLAGLLDVLAGENTPHEVIVADGGSIDGTQTIAARKDARLVQGLPGRGIQLRAGASAAAGDSYLFLHADTDFPAGGLAAIAAALADPAVEGGNFRLVFDGGDRFSLRLTAFYELIRRYGLYYGDSGIFIRRSVYETIGRIRPLALMEDFDLVRRMERRGRTVCIPEPALVTSSRRFHGRSAPAIVGGWLVIHALWYLGAPPGLLARLYDSGRRQQRPCAPRPAVRSSSARTR